MKFTLIYDGDLPAGAKKRSVYASKIRNELHGQLLDLWSSHVVMRQLAREARVAAVERHVVKAGIDRPTLPNYDWPIPPVPSGFIDLCAPIDVQGVGSFRPVIRTSLYLACAIDLLFLRHEEPLQLLRDGGDLDNRLKCFFDGLKVPDKPEKGIPTDAEAPIADPLCCLLEDDSLISDFSVRTGRLLGQGEKMKHAVRITANVTIKVLRVTEKNLCLVGD